MTDRFRVVGLDLSLTSTGMSDGEIHRVTQTSPDDPLENRLDRIREQVRVFTHYTTSQVPDLVVIEGGAFSRGAQSAGAEALSGLRYIVRLYLWMTHIPYAMVPPTTLKAYTTGYGKATKAQMVQAVRDRHGMDFGFAKVSEGRYDMADAFALAAMGYARIGQPLPTEGPPPPLKSLLAVKWPQLLTDN